jgi:hypothetical protein
MKVPSSKSKEIQSSGGSSSSEGVDFFEAKTGKKRSLTDECKAAKNSLSEQKLGVEGNVGQVSTFSNTSTKLSKKHFG